MPVLYQDLLLRVLTLLSVLELVLCFGFFLIDTRNRRFAVSRKIANQDTLDPFFTWINMLERQGDRRSGSRYEGQERRSVTERPPLTIK